MGCRRSVLVPPLFTFVLHAAGIFGPKRWLRCACTMQRVVRKQPFCPFTNPSLFSRKISFSLAWFAWRAQCQLPNARALFCSSVLSLHSNMNKPRMNTSVILI